MLVLKRRPTEKIILTTKDGTEIVVILASVKGNAARIAIDAPPEVTIIREEIAGR